jgi:hypothetical protein
VEDIREAIKKEFQRFLNESPMTVAAAAKHLDVSRQQFHSYLKGNAVPRPDRLAKAVTDWDLKIHLGEQQFDKSSFTRPRKPAEPATQLSLPLRQALDSIKEEDLKVSVKRAGDTLKVAVTIDLTA